MIKIEVTGLAELRAKLAEFSDRRFDYAVATAMTRTVKRLSQEWQDQVDRAIDKPTARTLKATGFKGAQPSNMAAEVFVKDTMTGTAPAGYLGHHQTGGRRLVKKFERALISSGAMPSGYFTVPGRHAKLDANGNVSRALIIAVIAQLGTDYSPGYRRVISKSTDKRLARQKRLGQAFVAVSPAQAKEFKVSPGIYERMADGSRKAVFLFQRTLTYRKRLSLLESGDRLALSILQQEITRSVDESLARLQARGRA